MVPPPSKAGRKKKQIDTYTNTTLTGSYTSEIIKYNYGNDGKTGWNYLLTSYDADSDNVVDTNEKISYDAIGNPTTYRGATLSWYGRQLTQFVKNGVTSKFTYDADGLRSTKTVGTAKTEYQYVGDKLFYEKRGDGNSFYYFYDSYGKLSAIYHYVNGTRVPYHVVTNAQGDVMALYNWSGTKVAEYSYDAWGNCTIISDSTSTGIATLNPFRYRSYYFDRDLGLYYLQSRYYDSEIGRFINADDRISDVGGVQGYNMYSYCTNNPVIKKDSEGTSEETVRSNEGGSTSTFFAIFVILAAWCYALTTTITACPPKTFSIPKIESKAKASAEADQKIRDTVKQDSIDRYWKADKPKDIVHILDPISFEEAVAEVQTGRNVFAVTEGEARLVAYVAGGYVEPDEPEIHGGGKTGYYLHYHTAGHGNAHIWYLF